MISKSSDFPVPKKRAAGFLLTAMLFATACATPGLPQAEQKDSSDIKTYDKAIAEKLGLKNNAYLLAVDIDGKVTPFVPDDPKASHRLIDPNKEKLTVELHQIEPISILAGKRNPLCVFFVSGTAKAFWLESCPNVK